MLNLYLAINNWGYVSTFRQSTTNKINFLLEFSNLNEYNFLQCRIFLYEKWNVHNPHVSVHRISMEQPVRHSTHCISLSKKYFLLSLSNRFISKEGKLWQWRKVLEMLLFLGPRADNVSVTFTHLGCGCLCSRPALLTVQLSHHESTTGSNPCEEAELCPMSCIPSTSPWLEPCCRYACAHPYPWLGQSELAWLWMLSAVTVLLSGSHQAVADLGVPASSALPQVVAG